MHEEWRWRGRPPQVWSLAAMTGVGAALCAFGALWPPSQASPRALNAVLAVVGASVSAGLWWGRLERRPLWLRAVLGVHVGSTTAVIAAAATAEGAISSAMSYVWASIYAAAFLGHRTARACAAAAAAGFAGAMVASPVITNVLHTWLVVAVTLVVAIEVLSAVLDRLARLAVTDTLTGLPTRTALRAAFSACCASARRSGLPVVVAVLDLDDLKVVNDTCGHAAGDRLLADTVGEWEAALPPQALFRTGGDEFVALLASHDAAAATALLRDLHDRSATSWSFGVAEVQPDDELDDVVHRADGSMYVHKARLARSRTPPPAPPHSGRPQPTVNLG